MKMPALLSPSAQFFCDVKLFLLIVQQQHPQIVQGLVIFDVTSYYGSVSR